jgi:hypothetical protein
MNINGINTNGINTNEVKAQIWNMCIEKGTFNKVKGEDFKEVQSIFEKIIKNYEKVDLSQEVFNKIIDSITLEILDINKPPSVAVSFEKIQKEYDELLNTPVPNKIDFTNIPTNTIVESNFNSKFDSKFDSNFDSKFTDLDKKIGSSQNEKQDKSKVRLEEIIMTQNKILIQILESQVKIIEALKK